MSDFLSEPMPPGVTEDFRARATLGVALTALTLLFPFVFISLSQGLYLMAFGSFVIVAMLATNAWLVLNKRSHETLTVYGLVPGGMLFMVHVFGVDSFAGAFWCYPSVVACYCMLSQRNAWLANLCILAFAVPTAWNTMDWLTAARMSATLAAVSLFSAILVRVIDRQQRRLVFQLEHDPLTGLLNRVSLKRELSAAVDAHRQQGVPTTALMLDVDHFKSINDRFGHEVGDRVLCEITRLMLAELQPGDRAFRMGGEEFLLLLQRVDAAEGLEVAERMRSSISGGALLQHHAVTVSVGVAELQTCDDAQSWTRRSDQALYLAKGAGRDRVHLATGVSVRDESASAHSPSTAADVASDTTEATSDGHSGNGSVLA